MTSIDKDIIADQVYDMASAKETWAMLHGYKAGFADANKCEEPSILLHACCVIQDYIRLLEKLEKQP